jgi:hypothetical protein
MEYSWTAIVMEAHRTCLSLAAVQREPFADSIGTSAEDSQFRQQCLNLGSNFDEPDKQHGAYVLHIDFVFRILARFISIPFLKNISLEQIGQFGPRNKLDQFPYNIYGQKHLRMIKIS